MGQPHATGGAPRECPVCPECRSSATAVTTKSDRGAYYRCATCGHIWHHDRAE